MARETTIRVTVAFVLALTSVESRAQILVRVIPFDSVTLTTQQVLAGEKEGKPITLAGELRLPRAGNDKVPLVILVHGVGGLVASHDEWARQLNSWGYAVFMADHLSGRGITPFTPADGSLPGLARMVDVYNALAVASKHPRVDPDRIALMGFSMGAHTTLVAMQERFRASYALQSAQVAAYIALYPGCMVRYRGDTKVATRPIRLFHGTADDWTPVEPCRALVADLKKAGADVTLTEFAGATHAYDMVGPKEGVKFPSAATLRNCAVYEGERGQLLNKATGAPFSPSDPCIEQGVSVRPDATATAATRDAVKTFLASVFSAKASASSPETERPVAR